MALPQIIWSPGLRNVKSAVDIAAMPEEVKIHPALAVEHKSEYVGHIQYFNVISPSLYIGNMFSDSICRWIAPSSSRNLENCEKSRSLA